jgi:cell cycle sensor histidine kinase DivJ
MIDERSEIVGLRKNGKEFPAEASLAKLQTPSGVFFAILLRDVTQQKIVRTELLNAKLAAEAANEAKSRFIANMSHELRTPLNAIIGFSQILAESTVDSEKVQAYARDIHDSGKHLLGIINDILQISRLELGGLSLREEEVRLEEVVNSCVRIVGDRSREAGLRVDIELEPALPLLWVDRRVLVQAVLNLLTNAIKFTEREGAVAIGARRTANGGVDVYVRDTGIGMAPEDVARVGQPFMQADSRLERRYDGTGLGLVITKRLTELHDGVLTVESAVGLGTMVSICLPAARVRGPAPQPVCCVSAERVSTVT